MSEITFVKYCPLCGVENPRHQAFCLACLDGDLSTVAVERRREAAAPCAEGATEPSLHTAPAAAGDVCVLELVENPAIRFAVSAGQTLGRTEKADVVLGNVPKAEWISGQHARMLRRGRQWYIQHIGTTNFIKVDGEQYDGQEEVAIHDDSIVVLSLTAFRVRMPEA